MLPVESGLSAEFRVYRQYPARALTRHDLADRAACTEGAEMRISVFGIGYVGAVTAACLARDGHSVVAVDLSEEKVRSIQQGLSPIVEPGLSQLIQSALAEGRLAATADPQFAVEASDLSFICV